jgi:stringent starvation protein B
MSEKTRPPDGPEDTGIHDDPAARSAAKRKLLLQGLQTGVVHVQLDARVAGVRVPPKHVRDEALVLKLSYGFPHTELIINERGVVATLRFSGQPFRCAVPWPAVWGLLLPSMSFPQLWPADVPAADGAAPEAAPVEDSVPLVAERPRLQLISDQGPGDDANSVEAKADTVEPAASAPESGMEKPKAPWLRIVR